MKYDQVKEMVALFNQSSNQEMQLETDDIKLYLNKQGSSHPGATHAPKTAETDSIESIENTPVEESEGAAIEAPLVGSIYLQPAPNDPQFVTVGQTVAVGDVVCVIEAMKMMTEVKSPVAGTITAILVQNEELVEYHQPLFKVKEG
ncbi:acetyl-CoA carboxylase biotin carboxyl carrier protein [Latilactobacillus curvatus]|uniref:acetyl-CoA carboxylase biotin carboxyl carrier protein n=1 Tax=Latilactobacillus curvatus TaxID=28038 RepID=UPI000FECB48B|nr:biotin/lipoyl-containing protein [Latilactobacillus curvatus]MDT3393083.1 acetyl-CoA carboxylase, biotin carboxyl carrier protein [Bacillota bacterium]QAR35454.1 acetyl-CoA carboxylase, biotin carboxyl carrier protein [Latilactobacillus curvatus]